jgi:hypothetical protein
MTKAARTILALSLVACVDGREKENLGPYVSSGDVVKVASSTTMPGNHCGDSFCGKFEDKTHAKIWLPIAAVAGVGVAAGGVAAGVLAAQQHNKNKESAAVSNAGHNSARSRNVTLFESRKKVVQTVMEQTLKDAVTTTSGVLANALLASQTTLSQGMLPSAEQIAQTPSFKASDQGLVAREVASEVTLTASPAEVGSATVGWIITGVVALGACAVLLLCTFFIICSSRKNMRNCTRHLLLVDAETGDADSTTDMSASSEASSMVDPGSYHLPRAQFARSVPRNHVEPGRPSVNGSDVEETPLLPEGAALPKFWSWLKEW